MEHEWGQLAVFAAPGSDSIPHETGLVRGGIITDS